MTHDETAALFERRRAAWSQKDPVRLAADYLEDAGVASPMFGNVEGRPAIEESFRSLFNTFPDHDRHEELIIEGDRVAEHVHVTATHSNELFGIPGTGKRFRFEAVFLYELKNGKIAHERRIYDFSGLLLQIGILKARPAKV